MIKSGASVVVKYMYLCPEANKFFDASFFASLGC